MLGLLDHGEFRVIEADTDDNPVSGHAIAVFKWPSLAGGTSRRIYAYLGSIGSIFHKMGKRTYLEVPALPVQAVRNFGGYHSNAVDEASHTLFKEVYLWRMELFQGCRKKSVRRDQVFRV